MRSEPREITAFLWRERPLLCPAKDWQTPDAATNRKPDTGIPLASAGPGSFLVVRKGQAFFLGGDIMLEEELAAQPIKPSAPLDMRHRGEFLIAEPNLGEPLMCRGDRQFLLPVPVSVAIEIAAQRSDRFSKPLEGVGPQRWRQ